MVLPPLSMQLRRKRDPVFTNLLIFDYEANKWSTHGATKPEGRAALRRI